MSLLSLPPHSGLRVELTRSMSEPVLIIEQDDTPPPKFPHTRAQLAALAHKFKQPDSLETDVDPEDRVSSSLVNKVVGLLEDDDEDDLKTLLKETFTLDDEAVSSSYLSLSR
jgi:hypothetical protein